MPNNGRPKIGVDIDGVTLDLITPLLKYYNRMNGTNYFPKDITDYSMSRLFGNDKAAKFEFVMEFYRSPEFRETRPVPGAQHGIAMLRKRADLVSITSRPADAVENETRSKMQRYFPGAFYDILFTRDFATGSNGDGKADACRASGISIMLEDSFEFASTCAAEGIPSILLDTHWNREWNHGPLPSNAYRAYGWSPIPRKVDELLS